MTEQEKKNTIRQLQDLNRQGVISDDEFLDKMSELKNNKEIQLNGHIDYNNVNAKGFYTVVYTLGIFICIALLIYFVSEQSRKNNYSSYNSRDTSQTASLRTNSNETDSLIIVIAQEFVKAELKTPSSAKFPWDNNTYTISKEKGNWVVKGYVDAQNIYGATVRYKFESCFSLEWIDGKDHSKKVYTLIY